MHEQGHGDLTDGLGPDATTARPAARSSVIGRTGFHISLVPFLATALGVAIQPG